MRKKFLLPGILLAGVFLLLSADGEAPTADGQALYDFITEENDYTSWPLWPGTEEKYQGTEPHGVLLTTYVNESALQAVQDRVGEMPDGAIIVKENYTADRNLDSLTVMMKKDGFNPSAGNYFWAKYGADGEIQAAGKVEGCINCHSQASGNDYLFSGMIR